jgi:glycosyltransferase involved in cell wall biosynthesis
MDAPAVSVVVPTRDRAEYLEVTLRSLAAQDLDSRYETIVVDDASGDPTPEVVRRAGVRWVHHDRPRALNAARNSGIREADADLIALVKPMFELRLGAPPDDDERLEEARRTAIAGIEAAGWRIRGSIPSPVPGARGAREFLVHARWQDAEKAAGEGTL